MAKGGDVMSLGISNADAVFKKGGELYTPEEAMEFANKISKKLMAKGGETEMPFDDEVIVRNFFDGDRKKYEKYQKEEERRKNEPLPFAKGGSIDSLKKDMNSKLDIHSEYYAKGGSIDEIIYTDLYQELRSKDMFKSNFSTKPKMRKLFNPKNTDSFGNKRPYGISIGENRFILKYYYPIEEYRDDDFETAKKIITSFYNGKSKMAKGGRLKVYDESYDVPIKTFNSFEKAKNWVLANHKKYDEITIEDAYLDTIVVDKTDTKDDIEFLFSDNMAKGGRTISIVNDGVKYDKSKYKAVYGDFDNDGTVNIDDANPLDGTKKNKVEQVELKDTFDKLLGVKAELDNIMYDAVDTLDKKAPKDADIYARTKTPYSILKKLVEKRMLDPEKGLTDMIGTTIAVDSQKELESVRDDIDGGLLGKVLDKDDYYKSPKAGYRAYHYIVEYKGVPVEVQLKTKNMKKLHEVSHEAYKNGTLNAKSLDSLSKTFMRADKGDAKAKAEISKLLSDKKLLASKVSKSTMAKGGKTKTKKPNSFFAVVKREQKEGESWKDAIQRVKKEKSKKK